MLNQEMQQKLMRIAMEEAELALARGDDPFGGVIADKEGNVIVRDGNRQNTEKNPTAHAEMVCIREAAKKLDKIDLSGYISVCNAESCPMCASALVISGIREFYVGTTSCYLEDFRPYIRMHEVLKASGDNITFVDGIFHNECQAIVERGCYCAIKTKNNDFSIRSGRS